MTVPNLPYWLEPVHTEFGTSGAISNAGREAGLPTQFWCSQFAGKSALPKRLYHGMVSAAAGDYFTMQDLSIWGPGYTYVIEITGCRDNRPMVSTICVVDWLTADELRYSAHHHDSTVKKTSFNEHLYLQYADCDDPGVEVFFGLRGSNQIYFNMFEGGHDNRVQGLSCAIDVWVYELNTHPLPTTASANSETAQIAFVKVAAAEYGMSTAGVVGLNDPNYSYVYRTGLSKYPNRYPVKVGKKYKVDITFKNGTPEIKSLGSGLIRVPDLSDIGLPYSDSYDPGGFGQQGVVTSQEYGATPRGVWATWYVLLPPTTYAAGSTTYLLSHLDLTVTEIP